MPDTFLKIRTQFRQVQLFSLILIIAASLFGQLLIIQLVQEEKELDKLRYRREEILQQYMEAMLNQETGYRGYIGSETHNPKFLQSYYQGVSQYANAQDQARQLAILPGQTAFLDVIKPMATAAREWQQQAGKDIQVVQNGGTVAGEDERIEIESRTIQFDAFRRAFHDAWDHNKVQMAEVLRSKERGWFLEGAFGLVVMGIGIAAAVWVGQRATNVISDQAARLEEQTERERQHQQKLSAQNQALEAHQTELQARNRELQLIGRITAIAAAELRADAIQAAFQDVLSELLTFDRCSIFLLESEQTITRTINVAGSDLVGWQHGELHPIADSHIARVLETAKPLYIADLACEPDHLTVHERALAAIGVRSFVMAPLIARGHVIGAINFASTVPNRYDAHTLSLIEQVAGSIAGALENARLYQEERAKAELLSVSIQETHHRVKNNLQAVSSLLDMQLMEAGEMVPRQVLQRTITQIKAIALVHDMLSHAAEDETVDSKKVIEKLLPLVTLSYRDVELKLDLTSMFLPMRRMTSLALIVNELALNSLKHCGEGACRIEVRSWTDAAAGAAHLLVQDNGPGFPPGFDPERDANVGLQLVMTLVRSDLSGTITFENDGGARAHLVFPLAAPPPVMPKAVVRDGADLSVRVAG
ncbi:MAG TPA: histidine kinase dimerization/phosphoacceptor domain -containing protein [Chthonomonadaceae bacterium]|nr:histidine kinase dimerization/phosphoacceptor domain -containing protein [Chthonomonadaceae bacterium]